MHVPNKAAAGRPLRSKALAAVLSSAVALALAGPAGAADPAPAAASALAQGTQAQVHTISVTPVAAGDHHSLMLAADGTVWAAGANESGQLGIQPGFFESSSATSVKAGGLSGVKAVAAGGARSVAVKADGTVWEWGWLGPGDTTYEARQRTELSNVLAVATGGLDVLALKADGTVWTWVAYGPTAGNVTQVPLTDIVAVAAGAEHFLALKSDGTVWAWGRNDLGQVGTGSTSMEPVTRPVQVQNMAVAVAAGGHHSLVIRSDGSVWDWGSDGTAAQNRGHATPKQVPGLSGVTAVATGNAHTLALKSDGTVWTWGGNVGASRGETPSPVQVPSLSGVVAVSAGRFFSVAAKSDGSVWTWGYNDMGQLADGSTSERSIPVAVKDVPAAAAPSGALGSVLPMQVAMKELISDVAPVMVNGKVLVPVRPVADWLGFPIGYDPETGLLNLGENIAPAYPGGLYTLMLKVNALNPNIYGEPVVSIPPIIHQGRVMVEADVLGKAFDFQYRWNAEGRELVLTRTGGQTARMLLTEQSFQGAELAARVDAAITAWQAASKAANAEAERKGEEERARLLAAPTWANLARDSASHLGQLATFSGEVVTEGVRPEGLRGALLATEYGPVVVVSDHDLGLTGKRVTISGRVRSPFTIPLPDGSELAVPTLIYEAHEVR